MSAYLIAISVAQRTLDEQSHRLQFPQEAKKEHKNNSIKNFFISFKSFISGGTK